MASLTDAQRAALNWSWRFWARPNQLAPDGDWATCLALAGRGFGKTEAGAQWVRERVASGARNIALVAETQKDLEEVMVPRLVAIHPPHERPAVRYRPVRMVWPNGAQALGYNGTEPDQLRGPEFDTAWCFVAGTMVETPSGQQAIEDLSPGDFVVTRKGARKVLANSRRPAPVGEVSFANGSILVGTADHPVYTRNGWTRLDRLGAADWICVSNAWSGTASGGTSTGATTREPSRLTALARMRPCTGKSIGRNTAASLKDATFTMLTGIGSTTTPQTSKPYLGRTTLSGTSRTQSLLARWREAWKHLDLSLQVAMTAGGWSSAGGRPAPCFARVARVEERKPRGKHPEPACVAAHSSRAGSATFVRSGASTFRPLGEREVFCLKVEGEPEYFANGILVHNCDELAKYRYAREAWDMLQFTMRAGDDPRVFVTTTPRPIPVIREIAADPKTVILRGSTFDNADNLPAQFLDRLRERYEGTRLGRQELFAEILDDLPGALFSRANFDQHRVRETPDLRRVVVAVDPSGTAGASDDGDSIGIVVAGKGIDGRAYVLADRTCKLSPDGWAKRAVAAYHEFRADRLVAERNYGGAMVEALLRTVDRRVSYKEVTASRGKAIRAEPVAALYEQGRVSHVGPLPELEDQMALMGPDGFVGEGSPDRLDAAVWALTELMLEDAGYRFNLNL